MSLTDRVAQELKAAMLARDAERLATLRLLKSALGYAQIEKKVEVLPDAEVLAVVRKEVKKRQDAAEQFTAGGRPEMAEKEHRERALLETFLPQAMPADELEKLVQAVIGELGATGKKDMGAVIKAVQARAGGGADGRSISAVVGRLLP